MDFDWGGRSQGLTGGRLIGSQQRTSARHALPTPAAEQVTTLIRLHRAVHADADAAAIRRGYAVAERMHRGQMRKSGDAYITHPLAVAEILAQLGMDTTTVVAALLHDTVEDTDYTMYQLREEFGAEIAHLVDGVTKFDRVFYGEAAEAETIRKMIIAASEDVRVLVIKLADRLHNMLTISARSPGSRVRIARTTQEVLVPLCDRLGIQVLRRELEDCVLATLEPATYELLRAQATRRPRGDTPLDGFVQATRTVLRSARIPAAVEPRPRHLYSIWREALELGTAASHDSPRVIIVADGSQALCYTALGELHTRWRPVPGRFKDFIAAPKNNLYRSLHTTVLGPGDQPIEVLIRTVPMHRNAEYGVVAAYRFPVGGAHAARARRNRNGTAIERATRAENLAWLGRLIEWQREVIDPVRFLDSLRCDLSEGQVHVFSAGRRLLLPSGATPVDVAYALGHEVGHRCVAASINGQLAWLSSPLAEGDVVEIHTVGPEETTGPDGGPIGPPREWLDFVRTPRARVQIDRWLSEHDPADPLAPVQASIPARLRIGRAALSLSLRRRGRGLASEAPLRSLAIHLGYPDADALFVAVADRRITADEITEALINLVDRGDPGTLGVSA